jgi:hypothetical protein
MLKKNPYPPRPPCGVELAVDLSDDEYKKGGLLLRRHNSYSILDFDMKQAITRESIWLQRDRYNARVPAYLLTHPNPGSSS